MNRLITKKMIAAVLATSFVVLVAGCGAKKEAPLEYFDFTVSEITKELTESSLIGLTPIAVVDDEDKNTKIATYTSQSDVFNFTGYDSEAMIHYRFTYDAITNKVASVSFFFDTAYSKDLESVRSRFLYHIGAIANIIDPAIDVTDVYNTVKVVNNNNERTDDIGHYEAENFILNAFYTGTTFNAFFTANTTN